MEIDWVFITKIVILSLIHWTLVPLSLNALIKNDSVLGGRKAPWAFIIVFTLCLGSLLYLIFHPDLRLKSASFNQGKSPFRI
jgi:hypothetical protein